MSASRISRASLIDALLEATPELPEGVEDEDLLAAARVMVATREAILDTAELAPIVPAGPAGPAGPAAAAPAAKIAELTARQTAWNDALAAARTRIGSQRIATGKLRAYRPRQP